MKHVPRKQFGQHWLRSERVLKQILDAAQLTSSDRVLEIGPGTGVLTRSLLQQAESVVAVEVDWDLVRSLRRQFPSTSQLLLIEADFLNLDLAAAIAPSGQERPNKVVANIPYYITGPIVERLLGTIAKPTAVPYESIVLLTQKEVAQRLCAKPGSRTFGALSVRVQYLADCEMICTVPPSAFQPPPKVDSAVVRLVPRPFEAVATLPKHLEMIVKLGFATKRKMLRNNLKSIVDRDRLGHLLEQLKVSPQARAEELGVAQWVALSNVLSQEAIAPSSE
ncbi:MAG: 16S rRNA (adenine(1518)-N(6)/adenine(1519)-N(6))-dimethyltransferase RsmA [Synechococcales cyanobacterium K44_A2020_017]|nr:16S rRNA (adenine(1518)-N(6)/adenine(1519)-N(6))-dimethyltransferase RsmA [Synechococcales cyanobacterium K32_A2020_035]MBF2094048.1 16S rRNA (adenine(1518)-N(6)/adenine(1519)-N(6))-dimethyltransferase RsmA [Synechococcales cyanobacterium K44_A2020_017]